jgi:putative ATP-dependent endonuclease of OLD family
MRTYLQSFYMDANRDIVQDLRNRKSYFGRVTSSYDLTQETIDEIEGQLNAANAKIIESIPSLQQTKERISAIGHTIGAASSKEYLQG